MTRPLPLLDTLGRLRITAETDAVLEAYKRGAGIGKQEKAVSVLHEWALRELSVSRLAVVLAPREGSHGTDGEGQ